MLRHQPVSASRRIPCAGARREPTDDRSPARATADRAYNTWHGRVSLIVEAGHITKARLEKRLLARVQEVFKARRVVEFDYCGRSTGRESVVSNTINARGMQINSI